jgi:peptide/nickel transport system substrate-binding protein
MERRKIMGLAAFGAVATLALAACGGGSSGGGGGSGGGSTVGAGYNKAVTQVVNPSSHKGGTLSFGISSTPDSTDPGNTYYAFMWNFTRLYEMPLMTYKSCPGPCGLQVVPDLAKAPGVVSDNGLTWTYHIQPNVKYEDGTTVTSADVKYAVERTYDRGLFPLGPNYYSLLLAPQNAACAKGVTAQCYQGPYKDKSKTGLTAVDTPNATTIVFHLAKPFAQFNYITAIPQSAPVPAAHDTGAKYQLHPWSTGPYKFENYQLNKQLTMVPNKFWNPATDPNAKQLASKITVTMNMNANDIDNRLLAGDLSVDMAGSGVQAAARAHILSSSTLKASADNPISGFLWFAYINTKVAPLNNVHCREAIEYAANKVNLQTAYGGPVAGGAIASTVAPPNVVGQKSFDLYEANTKPQGDPVKAKQQLAACGQAHGFTTGIAYRSDRPKEVAAATALQQALSQVGIKSTLHGYPAGTYYANFAGVPKYVHQHDLGIDFGGWAPDFPTGYGFFDFITAGNTIGAAGNTNIEELNDPVINNDLNAQAATSDPTVAAGYTSKIDMQVMKDAGILPEVYAKSLLYRPTTLTNVYVQSYYGMYNYAVLGLK